ncbi:MAG: HEAT repeat domain-containing protein [Planctomycetes bacterium]|nr:HEAT repeat domain-containing protein [Planctomycetota bacterium]
MKDAMLEILTLFVLALPPATDAAPRPAGLARAAAEDAREARRILQLSSGRAIRVLARERDGAWEYKSRGDWERLDPRAVLGAELESDALRAWRTERARADLKDLGARAELGRWAAARGLATEALAELDAVLEKDPDHAGALAVLRESWLFSVPSVEAPAGLEGRARAELLRFGASLPPAGREVAVLELARASEREALRAELAQELWSPVVVRRSFAALALRRIFPGEEVRPLLVHAVRDASTDVRRASARALRSAGDPALVVPLVRALESSSVSIRANAAAALGEMGYAAAVEPLVARMARALQSSSSARAPHAHVFFGRQLAYVQDFDVEVAQFQAVADPQVNVLLEGSTLDAAVIATREETMMIEIVEVRRALERLTGQRPGGNARAWLAWWEQHGASWRAADHAAPATASRG